MHQTETPQKDHAMSSPTSTAHTPSPTHPPTGRTNAPVWQDPSAVSAWVDGELPHEQEVGVADLLESDEAQEIWHRYHLIGDALRATAATPFVSSVSALSASHSRAMATQITAKARQPEWDVAPVTGMPDQGSMGLDRGQLDIGRPVAANDGVYRWKMAAGFASLAAVLGVTWGLSGSGSPQGGLELAQRTAPAAVALVAASAPMPATPTMPATVVASSTAPVVGVWVSTPHGDVLRDPRLEAFMQAHQQAGGASALQVPAGFLRNATFRAEQR